MRQAATPQLLNYQHSTADDDDDGKKTDEYF